MYVYVNTSRKVKEQEDASPQIHTIARDGRIIYYHRDEYEETEWGGNFGSGIVLHTHRQINT